MTRFILVFNFLTLGDYAFGITGATSLVGYGKNPPSAVVYDHFVDSTQVLSTANGQKQNCESRTSNVNSENLYDVEPKKFFPKKKMEVCSVEKKDIIEEIKKRNIMQLTIANQAELDKLPPSIKSLFPNGVSENGATVMLEAPLDNAQNTKPYDPTIPKSKNSQTTEPTYKIVGYWRNDNFVPGVPGNDVGNTNSHGLSIMQIGEDQFNVGISAETTLFTKRTGRARQKFIDKVDIKLLFETPGIKLGKLTVNARGEIGYTYISSKFRNNTNLGYGSTVQNSWHQAIGAVTYENAIVAKGDELNVGENGYSAKVMAVVSQLMKSESGKCFMKWELAAGGNVSQLKGSSYAEVSAAAKAGFKVGSNSSIYVESAYEVREYSSHRYSNTSFGVGVDYGRNTFKYTVDIPKGTEEGIAESYQDNDWSGKLEYQRKLGSKNK